MTPAANVLLVEDNPDLRSSLRTILELNGFAVDEAADGREGVEKALRRRPDIALVDLLLPGLTGYEVARRLRDHYGEAIRLAACSAFSHPEARSRASDAGFETFMVKPVDPEILVEWLTAAACS